MKYTNGKITITVTRTSDASTYYTTEDGERKRMLTTTFDRDYVPVKEPSPASGKMEIIKGRIDNVATDIKFDTRLNRLTEETPAVRPMGSRASKKIADLQAKYKKKFRKDLRYGSRKAKVEAKRALRA